MTAGLTARRSLWFMPKDTSYKGLDLFDMVEKEDVKTNPEVCSHKRERHSLTVWPKENFERLTMTCEICGRIRGRYPRE